MIFCASSQSRSSTGGSPAACRASTRRARRAWEEAGRDLSMHQQDLLRIADRGAAGLGVFDDIQCHGRGPQTGPHKRWQIPVPVWMHGTLALATQEANQPLAAPGDQKVDITDAGHQLCRTGPAGILHQLHQLPGHSDAVQPILQGADDGVRRAEGFLAAAQNAGVAGFQRQRRRVRRDIGAALVDDRYDAQGDADPVNLQPVGPLYMPQCLADRVRQGGDLAHPRRPWR